MKKLVIVFVLSFLAPVLFAQTAAQQEYINKWAPVAVSEMYRTGVPASITLAQGLLESRYGLSSLASEGNNHFGIKCHDWKGKSMFYDDDAKGECFRVYDSAESSFKDHSDFLRYRDRYKFLFEYKTTDYKAWAYGLKKAGYATDPNYPTKLIKYIEDFNLSEYDKMTVAQVDKVAAKAEEKLSSTVSKNESSTNTTVSETKTISKSQARKARRAKKKQKSSKVVKEEEVPTTIPESPLSIEEPKKLKNSNLEQFHFALSREAYSRNGIPFISSIEGETYSSIASSNNLYLKEILKFNDLTADTELKPGTIVYLQAKKNQSEKGLDKYVVGEDQESLREICQRFGVKMSSVMKMNGFGSDYTPREGDTIVLRGKRIN